MADTNTTSTTGSAKLTSAQRLEQNLKDQIHDLKEELSTFKERERLAAATPRPTAAPAASTAPPVRRVVENDRGYWFLRIIGTLVVVAILATGVYLYFHGLFPFSGNLVVAQQPAVACCQSTTPPAAVVAETPAPAGTCDLKCLQAKVEATCPGTSFRYEGTIVNGMNAEQVIALLKESKDCPTVTPVKVDVPEPRYIKVREPKPRKKLVVVRRAPPLVEVEEVRDNLPDAHCSTCRMFKRLNDSDRAERPVITRRREAHEAGFLPRQSSAPANGVVCVAVLQREPSALVLRDGPDNTGGAIIGWKPSTIGWRYTSRGYVGRVCFSAAIIANRDVVTLCGAENHSTFRRRHIRELLSRREIPASDPACLLGRSQCARYGL